MRERPFWAPDAPVAIFISARRRSTMHCGRVSVGGRTRRAGARERRSRRDRSVRAADWRCCVARATMRQRCGGRRRQAPTRSRNRGAPLRSELGIGRRRSLQFSGDGQLLVWMSTTGRGDADERAEQRIFLFPTRRDAERRAKCWHSCPGIRKPATVRLAARQPARRAVGSLTTSVGNRHLWIADTESRQLAQHHRDAYERDRRRPLSPDGRHIAYATGRSRLRSRR